MGQMADVEAHVELQHGDYAHVTMNEGDPLMTLEIGGYPVTMDGEQLDQLIEALRYCAGLIER